MKKYTNYNERLSAAITWLRFPLILFIIMLHCYSVQRLEGDHEAYFKVLYPFSLWMGETGVPGFFFISGFLFFLSKRFTGRSWKTESKHYWYPICYGTFYYSFYTWLRMPWDIRLPFATKASQITPWQIICGYSGTEVTSAMETLPPYSVLYGTSAIYSSCASCLLCYITLLDM